MSKPVIVPLDVIDEDELGQLVDGIEKLTHAKITIERQFILNSDSPAVMSGLEFLFGDILSQPKYQNPVSKRKNGHKEPKQKMKKVMGGGKKMEPKRGPHVRSIKINPTGEMISRFELGNRLAAYTIDVGTELHSPKHGKMIVQVAPDGGALCLVNESGEPL